MRRSKRWFAGKLKWTLAVSFAVHASVFALVLLPGRPARDVESRPESAVLEVIIREDKLPQPPLLDDRVPPPPGPDDSIFTDRFVVVTDKDANDNVIWDPNAADRLVPELPDGGRIVVTPNHDPNKMPEVTFVDYEVAPVIVKEVKPHYPEMAAASGIEADVVLLVFINESGNVEHVIVQSSSGFQSMDDEAVEAARKCKFEPALQNDRPVGVWYSIVMEFHK